MRHLITMFVLAMLLAGAGPLPASEAEEFSEANRLLFRSPHLARVTDSGTTLSYRYERRGKMAEEAGEAFSDRINVEVKEILDSEYRGSEVDFMTGERHRYYPPVPRGRGNPVLIAFLQHDVNRMGRDADGPSRHFQNRIKIALEESADVQSVTVLYDGKEVTAKRIHIIPYVNDEYRSRYKEVYWYKVYIFTVSDEIPGFIYRIESIVPSAASGAPPLQEDVLTLDRVSAPEP